MIKYLKKIKVSEQEAITYQLDYLDNHLYTFSIIFSRNNTICTHTKVKLLAATKENLFDLLMFCGYCCSHAVTPLNLPYVLEDTEILKLAIAA